MRKVRLLLSQACWRGTVLGDLGRPSGIFEAPSRPNFKEEEDDPSHHLGGVEEGRDEWRQMLGEVDPELNFPTVLCHPSECAKSLEQEKEFL